MDVNIISTDALLAGEGVSFSTYANSVTNCRVYIQFMDATTFKVLLASTGGSWTKPGIYKIEGIM